MIFLIILSIIIIAVFVGVSIYTLCEYYTVVGIILTILTVMLFGLGAAHKSPQSISEQNYKLYYALPYEIDSDAYYFLTPDEDGTVKRIKVYRSNVLSTFSTEKSYEVQVITGHYSKTPVWGDLMPDMYGEKDKITKAILYLPMPKE